jgi:hypothetical protein
LALNLRRINSNISWFTDRDLPGPAEFAEQHAVYVAKAAHRHDTSEGIEKTKAQEQKKHPEQWGKDLNPNRLEGQNTGRENRQDLNLRSTADIKEITECLNNFTDDELAQIRIVPPGRRLQQGAVYLDLRNPTSEPITAIGDMMADEHHLYEHHLYVAKAETPYMYWNRLVGAVCLGPASTAAASTTEVRQNAISEEVIDKTLEDSFPASDPPSWTTGREPKT